MKKEDIKVEEFLGDDKPSGRWEVRFTLPDGTKISVRWVNGSPWLYHDITPGPETTPQDGVSHANSPVCRASDYFG